MAADNPFQSPATEEAMVPASIRRPWLRGSLALAAFGFAVAFLGLVYGVFAVGVPFQDPTPEMARREEFHLAVSDWAMTIGGGLFLVAIVGFVFVLVARGISRLTT